MNIEYANSCKYKKAYHYLNAKKCKIYNRFIDVFDILLTASAALTLTVLSVTSSDVLTVTVVQGSFLFLITVNSKIKGVMEFTSLYYRHLNAGDEYSSLENEFRSIEPTDPVYKYLVSKYILTKQKLHIEEIKLCYPIKDNSSLHGSQGPSSGEV